MNQPTDRTPDTHAELRPEAPANTARASDTGAIEHAHARFGPGLRQFFLTRSASLRPDRSPDHAIVDDLCQQTWGECWKSVREGRYDPSRAALSTFLYAVASNIWLRHRRKTMNARETLSDAEGTAQAFLGTERDPARSVAFSELLEAVLRRVTGEEGGLSAQDRAVLLALSRGASDRDLAAQLNLAPSTAHARKTTALAKLRAALTQIGYQADDGSAER